MSAEPLAPGQSWGRYRIERRLGAGSSGQVFLAVDVGSGAPCALKILAPAAGADAQAAYLRFEAEARARQRLHHPDIQHLLDAGRLGDRAWLALEWVPGIELTRYTQAAWLLPPELVATIGARLAAALAHAHERGVLHRDLKPDNVLVNLPQQVVKLTDFGVARLDDDAQRTRSGELLGSPAYMAPELLAGAPADARSDVYALGVLLFELLAGRRPHRGDTLGELLRSIAGDEVPDLAMLRPELPAGLAAAVGRTLLREPRARTASAAQLAAELSPTSGPAPARGGGT